MAIPIIFSAPMVRALIEGRKSQTRRLITPALAKADVADLLWVREGFGRHYNILELRGYVADGWSATEEHERVAPSIHMPRAFSRITLKVTAIRTERLQSIDGVDAVAEGVDAGRLSDSELMHFGGYRLARHQFRDTWKSLHGPESWDANPLVIVLTFSVTKANIDDVLKREAA